MSFSTKVFASASALVMGLAGMAYAAGDHPSGSQSSKVGQESGQQAGQPETIKGEVQKVEGDVYTITSEEGEEIRLRIEKNTLKGKELQEGDRIQAKILKDDEAYNVISARKSEEGSSMETQSASGKESQQDEQFTKTISGEIKKVEGNVYYIQDSSGKEIRLRLDESAEKSEDFKEGDKIDVLVTKEKEFHVISAEPSQK